MVGRTILEEVGVTGSGESISQAKGLVEAERKRARKREEMNDRSGNNRMAETKEMGLAARLLVNKWWVEEQTACSSSTCSPEPGFEKVEP
jgi:hypothetical protein